MQLVASFKLPSTASTFGVVVGDVPSAAGTPVSRMMQKTDLEGGDYNVSCMQLVLLALYGIACWYRLSITQWEHQPAHAKLHVTQTPSARVGLG